MVPTARITAFSGDRMAYGLSNRIRKLSSVNSGTLMVSRGVASNGASTSQSMGNAKNTVISAIST